ncbi:MAG: HDOD domain-containing protein [Phycisphaerales bacterium JB040]
MDQDLLDEILNCPELPSLPAVAVKVLELTGDPDVKIADLDRAIRQDQALSARILKTVNSSFFGLRERCSSIEKALVLLGLGPVKSLVLGFSLVSTMQSEPDDPFDFPGYWRRGLYTGIAARLFAEKVCKTKADEAFLAGLLQDVGMVAMYRALGERYLEVLGQTGGEHARLNSLELKAFEIDHASIGAMLCESWKLPQDLVLPVKFHVRPSAAPQQCKDLVQCVALGNAVHDALLSEDPTDYIKLLYDKSKQWWNTQSETVDEIVRRCSEAFEEIAGLFNVDAGEPVDPNAVLQTAETRMREMARLQPRESFAASKLEDLIQGADEVDPFTGALGRSGFDAAVNQAFEQAGRGEIDLSIVQIFVDGLGALSTEQGDLVSDEVVLGLNVQMQRYFEPMGGVICRLAQQLFAVVLPDTSADAAQTVVEQFTRKVESSLPGWIPSGADPTTPIRVNLGVATMNRQTRAHFTTPDELIIAVTRALKASRQDQGHAFRAFIPKAA